MSTAISALMLPEFDREMAKTKSVLETLTQESMSYQPNERLHTIGWNANHLLDIVGWTNYILNRSELDLAPEQGPPIVPSKIELTSEIVARYGAAVVEAREVLAGATDSQLNEPWSLKLKGQTFMTLPKGECLRTWVLNHTVHHRAILSVYLRMFGIDMVSVFGS